MQHPRVGERCQHLQVRRSTFNFQPRHNERNTYHPLQPHNTHLPSNRSPKIISIDTMPNPTTHMHPSSSANVPPLSSHAPVSAPAPAPAPRQRAQGARKRAAAADDAAYHAAAGTKRAAADRAEGDRERVKRKRADASGAAAGGVGSGHNAVDKEERTSLVSVFSSVCASRSACYVCPCRGGVPTGANS